MAKDRFKAIIEKANETKRNINLVYRKVAVDVNAIDKAIGLIGTARNAATEKIIDSLLAKYPTSKVEKKEAKPKESSASKAQHAR